MTYKLPIEVEFPKRSNKIHYYIMSELQRLASNPEYSVWVSASAGTGKTKILTDRVLRLLIKGVELEKIVCLTFTNAAALEMQARISQKLKALSNKTLIELSNELTLMMGTAPSEQEICNAKTLYISLLEKNEKINIYTIHSFCQKILKSFSLEAGVNPEFQILDEVNAQKILATIKNNLYLDPTHGELINFFLFNFHETILKDIFSEIIAQRIKFKNLFACKNIKNELQKDNNFSEDLLAIYEKAKLLLIKFSLNEILEEKNIEDVFFTKDGKKRKKIISNEIKKQYPELVEKLEDIQSKAYELTQSKKTEEIYNYSALIYKLAEVFLHNYEIYKSKNNLLDYEDLIYHTKLLLQNRNTKNWILHKLEGWFDHLLVDEAQDTSPEQWFIITQLITEFMNDKEDGSIFIVGDEKQSIFSFQGANLITFKKINELLQSKFALINKKFKNITLEISYRSTEEILEVVYKLLERIKHTIPNLFTSHNPKISSFRATHKGKVEIWPITSIMKEEYINDKKDFWPLPNQHINNLSNDQILAKKIANFIKEQIASKNILPSTGKAVTEGDFMILVRTRDDFIKKIIYEFEKLELSVEGLDRVLLNENLAILDLMALAKFVLLPEDNLNLANLLKSPIIGISEDLLYNIIALNNGANLWDIISTSSQTKEIYQKLSSLLDIHKVSNGQNFFELILNSLNLKEILININGESHKDAIDAFISLSSNYFSKGDSSLQGFIFWFENNNIQIKRDIEASDKIRIMTVHGSKGLQAPIVILCDTTTIPINKNHFIWTEDGQFFSSPQVSDSPDWFKDLKEQQKQKDLQEYIRLLYVAMTRAEDHLIICGASMNNKLPEYCWYELIYNAMKNLGYINQQKNIIYEDKENENFTTEFNLDNTQSPKYHYKSWFLNEDLISRITKYNHKKQAAISPLILENHLEYGRVFHRILEDSIQTFNSEISMSEFKSFGYNHPLVKTLSLNLQKKFKKSFDTLLSNKEFNELFKQKLMTEVNIGIEGENEIKIGRIDLLAITASKITIIDYKSDNKPLNNDLVPLEYIDQLNYYRHIMQKLYFNHEIVTKILWLETGKFTHID